MYYYPKNFTNIIIDDKLSHYFFKGQIILLKNVKK